MNIYPLVKNFLFKFDPETAHNLSLDLANQFSGLSVLAMGGALKAQPVEGKALKWRHPVGIAAGLDKNATALKLFKQLGVGALEIGTVTPKPQIGNAKPRIWRLPAQSSLRNAMGFPNDGAERIRARIRAVDKKNRPVLGVNIGKNKWTPNERALEDYLYLYDYFKEDADYLVVNISSPNTKGLRDLQNQDALDRLLSVLSERRKPYEPPLFLKIAPDLELEEVKMIADLVGKHGLAGLVATNTSNQHSYDSGGISGAVITERCFRVHKFLLKNYSESMDLILVGGLGAPEDFRRLQDLGGKFFQVYSQFVYRGLDALKVHF